MGELRVEQCRSCHADVIWLPHEATGRRAPIDAAENPEGNVVIDAERGVYVVLTQVEQSFDNGLAIAGAPTLERHTSHFATCPHARGWRRVNRWKR